MAIFIAVVIYAFVAMMVVILVLSVNIIALDNSGAEVVTVIVFMTVIGSAVVLSAILVIGVITVVTIAIVIVIITIINFFF